MIRENTISAVFPLAQMLASKGRQVRPKESTPVDQLVKAANIPIATQGTDTLELDDVERILKGSRLKQADGSVLHDVVMDELVDVVSKTVMGNLDIARNVVNPIIKEVVLDTESYIEAAVNLKRSNVEILPFTYADIWSTPALADMVDRYADINFVDVPLKLRFKMFVDKPTLLELAKTGAVSFDQTLEDLCAKYEEDYVVRLFNRTFTLGVIDSPTKLSELINANNPLFSNQDDALLVHLWARKLLVEIPEDTGMSLNQYKEYITLLIAQSGRVVAKIIERRERVIRMKDLVLSMSQNTDMMTSNGVSKIIVNADVYSKWLEEGGTPETLMGSWISDRETNYKNLIDKREMYEAAWIKHDRIIVTKARLEKFNYAVEGIKQAISKQIVEMDTETLMVPKEVLQKRLNESVGLLYGKFYDDLWVYARKMVCTVLFPHTNALEILCSIDDVSKDFPGIDVREAALLATIEVMGNWISKLLYVESCTPEEA